MTPALPCCLGKLPIHGDFIRWNHNVVPEIAEFDAWLLQGMERAYDARGRAFDAELRELPALRFLYSSGRTGRTLAGVVVPSQDQVGRVYPFTLGFQVDAAPGPAFDRLPLATAALQHQALELLGSDLTGTALPALLDRVKALAAELNENAAEQQLRNYLFGTTLDQLLGQWPGFVAAARRSLFLTELRQILDPPFPPRYVACLPSRAVAGEVAFWLTLLRQWLPIRRNPTLVMWPAVPGSQGPLRLLFDEPAARYFEPMFWPRPGAAELFDLGRNLAVGPEAPLAGALPTRSLLQDVILAAANQ